MKVSRLWLIVPWAAFVALALAWVGYWHYVAAQAETQLASFAAAQRQAGGDASYARVVRRGFPALMRLELHDLDYAPARAGWRATSARADVHVDLLNPAHVIVSAEAPIVIARADGRETRLAAQTLIASLETRGDALTAAGVEGDEVTLDDPGADGVLRAARVVLNIRPDARAAGDYQVAFDALNVTLPRPVRSFEQFGLDVPQLRAAIVLTHGATLLEAGDGDPLEPWRQAGGAARFEALALNWGPLQATGAGEGGLDEARRLQGRLTLPIEQPGPIFAALANGPRVDESARRALALLAAGYQVSGDGIELDVEAANGVLRLEGFPVRPLPPVY